MNLILFKYLLGNSGYEFLTSLKYFNQENL